MDVNSSGLETDFRKRYKPFKNRNWKQNRKKMETGIQNWNQNGKNKNRYTKSKPKPKFFQSTSSPDYYTLTNSENKTVDLYYKISERERIE